MKNFKYLLLLSASFGILSTTANASPAEILGDEYSKFKNYLSTTYGFDYGIDYSLMWQRTAPSGSHNAVQSYLYPYFSWTTFDNRYGTGTLNFAYDSIFYGHHDANDIGGNSGMVTPINDYILYIILTALNTTQTNRLTLLTTLCRKMPRQLMPLPDWALICKHNLKN